MPGLEEGSLSGIHSTVQLGSPPHYIKEGEPFLPPPCTFALKIDIDGLQAMDADGKDILFFIEQHLSVFNVISEKIK